MASEHQAHQPDAAAAAAHPGVEKTALNDNGQVSGQAHNDAYAALVKELQNTPELRSFFKQLPIAQGHPAGSEGPNPFELHDNASTVKPAVSDQKKDPDIDWGKFILEHDHSRDIHSKKISDIDWGKFILEHDHSRDVYNK